MCCHDVLVAKKVAAAYLLMFRVTCYAIMMYLLPRKLSLFEHYVVLLMISFMFV